MGDLLIDGKTYDMDTFEETGSLTSSGSSDHSHDISISEDSSGFLVEVVRDDGKTWTWSLQEERLIDLLDNLNSLGVLSDNVDGLRTDLSALSDTTQQSLEELQEVVDAPEDFYEFSADIVSQILFFISLIFGLLVFIVFSSSFRK